MNNQKFSLSDAKKIMQEISDNEFKFPLDKCYFHGDKDHFCEVGTCMRCDYDRYLKTLPKDVDWSDDCFIEAWDWWDMWTRKHNQNKSTKQT